MNISGIQLTLLMGPAVPLPAPYPITSALRSASVSTSGDGTSGFQLQFQVSRGLNPLEYDLLSLPQLAPFSRVVVMVTMNMMPRVLVDGMIVHRELVPGRGGQPDTINVTGQDLSIALNMTERSMAYPFMNDMEIVELILLEYLEYGIIPEVMPTEVSISTEEVVTQQVATDLDFINALAERNGYIFQITPGPVPLTNVAYFGPPKRAGGLPQPALTVNQPPAGNVDSIRFSYDALAPTLYLGDVQDTLESDMDVPVITFMSTRMPPLALEPAILVQEPYVRKLGFDSEGMDPMQAYAKAQGLTDASTDKVLTATGELDVLRYQHILTAPGIVGVRGVGFAHDGFYFVQSVTHEITPHSYRQSFTLAREGMGTITPEVIP